MSSPFRWKATASNPGPARWGLCAVRAAGLVARRVARELGTDVSEEVILYLVHGLLHLCGYDDRDELQRQQMRRREAEVLSLLEVAVRVTR